MHIKVYFSFPNVFWLGILANNLRLTEFLVQFISVDSPPPALRLPADDIEDEDRGQNHLDTHRAPLKPNLKKLYFGGPGCIM